MGAKVPKNKSFLERSQLGVKVPGSESSRERIGQVLLELLLQGANWPGSEKAAIRTLPYVRCGVYTMFHQFVIVI